MRIVDYQMTTETLSWFRGVGMSINQFLALRRIPSFNFQGKGVVPRIATEPEFWLTQPIPSYNPDFARGFAALMADTATALLAEGKLIRVAWSGGLDSTGALLALKAVGATPAQVEVYYTADSIAEYPNLVSFVEQNFTPVLVAQETPVVSADSLWVTGEGGNQIFFPVSAGKFNKMRTKFQTPANELPWEDFFFQTSPDYEKSGLDGAEESFKINSTEKTIARNFMSACPFTIVTVEQAQWWRTFALHWQHIYYRMGSTLSQADFVQFATNHRPFFMTNAWQRWSMKRMANKTPDTSFLMLKKPLKDFINTVFPDQDYYDTKAAVGSLRIGVVGNYVRFEDGSIALTESEFRAKIAL